MYRVSPFVRHFAWTLLLGVALATLWVNLDPSSYYDSVEFRLYDLSLLDVFGGGRLTLTPMFLVAHGAMALFLAFLGKELWEALVLERGAFHGRNAAIPLSGVLGGSLGAVLVWVLVSSLIETAQEASFGLGWQVPLGSDVVLGYVIGRRVFGAGHPALHLLLLTMIGYDLVALLLLGFSDPTVTLRLVWLMLPLAACVGVWAFFGRKAGDPGPEVQRRRGQALWPYLLAGLLSYIGVSASGLPPVLGLLPVIPAIPHADRSFGVFAEAEAYLHDPLNRLAHLLVKPVAVVLFLFGLTRGGIDFAAFGPTTLTVLAALWIGKPLGLLAGMVLGHLVFRVSLPEGIRLRSLLLLAMITGMGFTVPVLALESALPGGGMTEGARLGLALSLLIGPLTLLLARGLAQNGAKE